MVKDQAGSRTFLSRFSYQSLPTYNRTINGVVVYIRRRAARRGRQYNYRGTSLADRPLLRGAPDKARTAHCPPHRAFGRIGPAVVTQMRAERLTWLRRLQMEGPSCWPSGKTSSPREAWWMPFGLSAGKALGAKTTGIIAIPLIFLGDWLSRSSPVGLQPRQSPRRGVSGRVPVPSGFIALVAGGWTYAQNAIRFGNPVYPFPINLGFDPNSRDCRRIPPDYAAILAAYRQPESEALIRGARGFFPAFCRYLPRVFLLQRIRGWRDRIDS